INYETPEAKAEHWKKVKPEIKFGDDAPETANAREKLMALFEEDHDIFALQTAELGLATDTEFDFELTEKPPIQYPRRLPQALKQKVYDKLLEDVEAGITVHSNGSEFASPIVVVKKKNGDIRIASDFRQLNLRTVMNAAPLPRIDDIFDAIGDVKPKFFTALDMASGFHQIKMSRKAQRMSAIVCGPYHLEWTRMPFGLSQSPQFFMSYMTRTLQGIDDRRI
ncbi:MAG: RNA-directed DNA polymerase, partial [Mesoflavibacter sp.]|nr:RNA-directed DNA polymerase [Mesoflavibacter sp.]